MHPGLAYAENALGVHQVYTESLSALEDLDVALNAFDSAVDKRHSLDDRIEDRQMQILIEERGQNSELSEAAMTRRLKEKYHTDERLSQLKLERNAAAAEASGLELDIEHIKYRLKVKVGRMEELGGYLAYLAALKNAESPPIQYAEAGTSGQPAVASGETK